VQRFFDQHIRPYFEDMSIYDGYANNHPCTALHHLLDQTYGCRQYRIIAKEVPMVGAFDAKGCVVAVMIHNEVFVHDIGESARNARVRVAKMALEKIEGLELADFRERFKCDCSDDSQANGSDAGVRADCAV
jgi:endoribonuclease Dicer